MWSGVLASVLLVVPALAASADEWRSRSIYQLVTDRFATTDGDWPACDTEDRVYCGGTWQGIINKLDYIQNMGFDAIWISPIVANLEGNTGDGESYHGYWTVDQNSLNYHFGSEGDLLALSSALHDRGMYLMLDVVVNHMGADTLPPDYSLFSPFNSSSDFHTFCWITDYNNQTNVEQCWLGDDNVPLADMDTEADNVIEFFYNWITRLVNDYGADGVRIDTVKHIRKTFWPEFATAAGAFTVGEIFDGSVDYVAPYTEVVDAVLDYPTYYQLTYAFQSTSGSISNLVDVVQSAQSSYKNGEFMAGSFLENQDNPRFQSLTTDQSLVKNAMAWPFIQDGVPILYYGQEQGYTGGNDPYNREALWLSGYVEDKPLVKHVRTLNAARKAAINASSEFLYTALTFPSVESSTLAVSKYPMLSLLTNGGESSTPSWSVSDTGFSAGTELIDVLNCTTYTVDSSRGLDVTGYDGLPIVLLPISAFNSTYCKDLLGSYYSSEGYAGQSSLTLPVD
ncbi:glycoside hydrolase family 13 protein [Laetiporus sulphureus 93-53]|uniref:alpha-amylase n=1 Tax=Laetiporus sulphureus 93-53 TaxID=1314785 RepID=A0A165DLF6_9APHY|nr:glycoside hydrolase family 13 protein [Laetiporus sulphureus 93-53]KZT05143.1 glycoside hydrolase family 13 protein [Laetiporus sulphureus 93-53]